MVDNRGRDRGGPCIRLSTYGVRQEYGIHLCIWRAPSETFRARAVGELYLPTPTVHDEDRKEAVQERQLVWMIYVNIRHTVCVLHILLFCI